MKHERRFSLNWGWVYILEHKYALYVILRERDDIDEVTPLINIGLALYFISVCNHDIRFILLTQIKRSLRKNVCDKCVPQ